MAQQNQIMTFHDSSWKAEKHAEIPSGRMKTAVNEGRISSWPSVTRRPSICLASRRVPSWLAAIRRAFASLAPMAQLIDSLGQPRMLSGLKVRFIPVIAQCEILAERYSLPLSRAFSANDLGMHESWGAAPGSK
jgi:hypothetical protein